MNAFVAQRISHAICMTLMFTGTIVGELIVHLVGDVGHGNDTTLLVVFRIGIAFMGTSYSYGETVDLLFVQRYPPHSVVTGGRGGVRVSPAPSRFRWRSPTSLSSRRASSHRTMWWRWPTRTAVGHPRRVLLHSGLEGARWLRWR